MAEHPTAYYSTLRIRGSSTGPTDGEPFESDSQEQQFQHLPRQPQQEDLGRIVYSLVEDAAPDEPSHVRDEQEPGILHDGTSQDSLTAGPSRPERPHEETQTHDDARRDVYAEDPDESTTFPTTTSTRRVYVEDVLKTGSIPSTQTELTSKDSRGASSSQISSQADTTPYRPFLTEEEHLQLQQGWTPYVPMAHSTSGSSSDLAQLQNGLGGKSSALLQAASILSGLGAADVGGDQLDAVGRPSQALSSYQVSPNSKQQSEVQSLLALPLPNSSASSVSSSRRDDKDRAYDNWRLERERLLAEAQLMRRALEEGKMARAALRAQVKQLQQELQHTRATKAQISPRQEDAVTANPSDATTDPDSVSLDSIPTILRGYCINHSKSLIEAEVEASKHRERAEQLFLRCAELEKEVRLMSRLLAIKQEHGEHAAAWGTLFPSQSPHHSEQQSNSLEAAAELQATIGHLKQMLTKVKAENVALQTQLEYAKISTEAHAKESSQLRDEVSRLRLLVHNLQSAAAPANDTLNASADSDDLQRLLGSAMAAEDLPEIACDHCKQSYSQVLSACRQAVQRRDVLIEKAVNAIRSRDDALAEWQGHAAHLESELAEVRAEAAEHVASANIAKAQTHELMTTVTKLSRTIADYETRLVALVANDTVNPEANDQGKVTPSLILRALLREQQMWRSNSASSSLSKDLIELSKACKQLELATQSFRDSYARSRSGDLGESEATSLLNEFIQTFARLASTSVGEIPPAYEHVRCLTLKAAEQVAHNTAQSLKTVCETFAGMEAGLIASEW